MLPPVWRADGTGRLWPFPLALAPTLVHPSPTPGVSGVTGTALSSRLAPSPDLHTQCHDCCLWSFWMGLRGCRELWLPSRPGQMPSCHCHSPAEPHCPDFPQRSRSPSPPALVGPPAQRGSQVPPGGRIAEEAARLTASCQSCQRELLPALYPRCALWPCLGSIHTVAPAALQQKAGLPWALTVKLMWCSGVCCLQWFSFPSHSAGINLRYQSACKRRTTWPPQVLPGLPRGRMGRKILPVSLS